MRLSWNVAVAVAIGGFWTTPAFAFGHKHGCNGGTAGFTTVSVPATVTTTRTSSVSVPAFAGASSLNFSSTPAFVTGSSITNFTPSFAQNTITFVPSTFGTTNFGAVNFGGASTANIGSGDIATLNQSIQTLNATLTRTNLLLAKLAGDTPVGGGSGDIPDVGDTGGFGGAGITSVGTPRTTALQNHQLRFEAHIRAGNLLEAKHQWEKGVAYQQKWDVVNKEMEAKLKALKQIP